jgi:hypothetical protein
VGVIEIIVKQWFDERGAAAAGGTGDSNLVLLLLVVVLPVAVVLAFFVALAMEALAMVEDKDETM